MSKQEPAKNAKKTKNKANEALFTVLRVIAQIIGCIIAIPVGCFTWVFDGYCGGGKWCSRPPGIATILFTFLALLSISQFFLTSKKFKNKRIVILIITIVLTILLYIYRLSVYYKY